MLYEIHMLKNYPPVNLNRDESGAPKSCIFGGTTRGRVSSQCLKRSWRTSPLLAQAIGAGQLGIRTRQLPRLAAERLAEMGVSQEYIDAVFPMLSGFGNKDGAENKDGSYTAQIIFYAPEDIQAVAEAIYEKLKDCWSVNEVKELKAKELQEAVKGADARPITLDMALFGRMVTSNAFRDVEAAMQVAHAISTNKLNMESDYFTAMDDLLSGGTLEEKGAAIISETDYNSACYYLYASLDTDILRENLRYTQDAEELIRAAIPALIRTMALANPSGKQNSFAGHVLPSAILIECKEEKVPVSMVNAFVRPVKPEPANDYDLIKGSIQALADQVDTIQNSFGLHVKRRLWFCPAPYTVVPECETTVCGTLPELVEQIAGTLM
ncbi:type I-E CRISPR-associated protein Cas7/Cse4/CasC [Pseudoflavonifractor sp.]|jgi:CRISPR system Cascade subunit CasC|uniref:type I-E CRISPR-associated protein Cas7/Cse4/CasC n=1 Tax=Pseudoflavonifractor sp. TaxID=1980281 RepID=UPI003D8FC7CA